MQLYSKRHLSHRAIQADESTPPDALDRLRRIGMYDRLRSEGCSEAAALDAVGWSRATLHRWKRRLREGGPAGLAAKSRRPRSPRGREWSRAQQWAVWNKRAQYPFMGKARLRVMLARDGVLLSESTIGLILGKGIALGHARPCAFLRGRAAPKRRRDFSGGHARRLPSGMRASAPGELVQIDHMSVSRDGQTLKEFRAVCPAAKLMFCLVFSRATARNARRFLEALLAAHPWIKSIQVDGGSEFMAEFEAACRDLGLTLFVLPPRSPRLNGCVERASDASRTEFWALYSGELTVAEAAPALAKFQHFHHTVRPHMSLDWKTPFEYLSSALGLPAQSHMC
ncbi:MAG: integrase core domain-containing protein [Gammaproteobacteria bacterium]|nr:integrase core domain-containing protein [Gammaproteobacteria bacterium]